METINIIIFLAGTLVGGILSFIIFGRSKSGDQIGRQLRELQEEFTVYRENVNSHFSKTAEVVNSLTENYIAVQNHLENAADSFAEPPKSFKLEESTEKLENKPKFASLEMKPVAATGTDGDADFDDKNSQQPLDYAPKSSKEEAGTLAEEYGLNKQS